jgi:hypothetical protein
MQTNAQAVPVSKAGSLVGRAISSLMALFLLFDGGMKVLKLAPAVEGTVRLGYPVSLVFAIGFVDLICVAAYAVPRTSILGAILLTGYLGGAIATQLRMREPWFLFPFVIGVLLWAGLFLRDVRLRALIPWRS